MSKTRIKINNLKMMNNYPHPHLYIEKKSKRYVFYKRLLGKGFILRVPFYKIRNLSQYLAMCDNWNSEFYIQSYDHMTNEGYGSGEDEDYENEYLMRKYYS